MKSKDEPDDLVALMQGVIALHENLKELISAEFSGAEVAEMSLIKDKPAKLPFGVSPRGAELYVAAWLKFLSFDDIEVTPPRRDGGYDVRADEYVVEVKNWNKDWIQIATVREIFGVATHLGKKAMLFSRGFLSEDASAFAESAGVPVFLFNAEEAVLQAANSSAEKLLESQMANKGTKLLSEFHAEANLVMAKISMLFCHGLAQIFNRVSQVDFLELTQSLQAIAEETKLLLKDELYESEVIPPSPDHRIRAEVWHECVVQIRKSTMLKDKIHHIQATSVPLIENLKNSLQL